MRSAMYLRALMAQKSPFLRMHLRASMQQRCSVVWAESGFAKRRRKAVAVESCKAAVAAAWTWSLSNSILFF